VTEGVQAPETVEVEEGVPVGEAVMDPVLVDE